jgi:hypothetical protein
MAITPHPLIGFASEYMRWKALLRDFPLDGVLSTTTHDSLVQCSFNTDCMFKHCLDQEELDFGQAWLSPVVLDLV